MVDGIEALADVVFNPGIRLDVLQTGESLVVADPERPHRLRLPERADALEAGDGDLDVRAVSHPVRVNDSRVGGCNGQIAS